MITLWSAPPHATTIITTATRRSKQSWGGGGEVFEGLRVGASVCTGRGRFLFYFSVKRWVVGIVGLGYCYGDDLSFGRVPDTCPVSMTRMLRLDKRKRYGQIFLLISATL